MAVEITRLDLSAADLRREAARSQDAKAARRMLAIALVLEGRARGDAARSCGMDRQTLRETRSSRQISLIDLPWTKWARRIRATVSTTNIPNRLPPPREPP